MNPSIQKLLQKIVDYSIKHNFDTPKIKRAFEVANHAHKDQMRKSGEPYILHPLMVCCYLLEFTPDEASIIATLLHDTIEDTPLTLPEVKKAFGTEVANLIDGLTKFSKNKIRENENLDDKIESLRKLMQITEKDIRTLIIKLLDRLHNLETLSEHRDPEKIQKIAKESLDFYVKISKKLGINKLKNALGSLCVKYLDPKAYQVLSKLQASDKKNCKPLIEKIKDATAQKQDLIFDYKHIPLSILGMYKREIDVKENLKGILATKIRILCLNETSCYEVLASIHKKWPIDEKHLRDFLYYPATNGYQGIITKILLENGDTALIEIQTSEIETKNALGIAYYAFDKKYNSTKNDLLAGIGLISKSTENHSQDFWKQIQREILDQSILVHTNKQQALVLPPTATVLDGVFYSKHEKGCYLKKVFINGEKANLYQGLKEGDTISFELSEKSQLSHNWIYFCETTIAQNYIRQGLKKMPEQKKLSLGKKLLNEELIKEGKGFVEELNEKSLRKILQKYDLSNLNSLYIKIAESLIDPSLLAKNVFSTTKITEESSKQTLTTAGTPQAITTALAELDNDNLGKINFQIKTANNLSKIEIKNKSLDQYEWQNLLATFKRHSLQNLKSEHLKTGTIIILIAFLSTLWGIDPLIAKNLTMYGLDPALLSLIRFSATSILFFLIIFGRILFKKTIQEKPISPFDPKIIILSGLLFGTIYFSYLGLKNSIASDYILSLRTYAATFLILQLAHTPKINKKYASLFYAISLSGVALLLSQSSTVWPTQDKIFTLISVLCFGSYSYFLGYFQENNKIFGRYYFLQLVLCLNCAIFSFILSIPKLTQISLIPANILSQALILSALVFTSHLIYFKLIKYLQNATKLGYFLNMTFFVTLFSEIFTTKTFPSTTKIISILLVYTGLILLYRQYSKNTSLQ